MRLSFFHRRRSRSLAPISGINITPMVDIMLILLVVFMVTAPLLTSGVAIELPKGQGKALDTQNNPIVVTINSAGVIYLDREHVSQGQLQTKVSKLLAANPQVRFFVRADSSISYGQLMRVVSIITGQGVKNIAFVTDPASGIKATDTP